MIRKILNLFYLLLICTHYNAFALLDSAINEITFYNSDLSEIIKKTDYRSDLAIVPNKITVYEYCNNQQASSNIVQQNRSLFTNINHTQPNIPDFKPTFILIPRNLNFDTNNFNYHNKLDNMENFIANNSDNFNLERSESFIKLKQLADNLHCDQEFILAIKRALNGSHGLYSPENTHQIEDFNGVDRVLSLAITPIDSLSINNIFSNNSDSIMNPDDLAQLQLLLYKTAKEAKTVLFIPEYGGHTPSETLMQPFQLPVAIIKNVSSINNNYITLSLECLKPKRLVRYALRRFNDVKKHLQSNETINKTLESELKQIDHIINLTTQRLPIDARDELLSQATLPETTTQSQPIKTGANTLAHSSITNNNNFSRSTDNSLNYPIPESNQQQNLANNTNIDAQQQRFADIPRYNSNKSKTNVTTSKNKNTELKWLCDHYKRKCFVKFACCEQYYPCHRCHNNDLNLANDHNKKLKAKNTQKLKCNNCKTEQDFNSETSHSCQKCGIKFSEFFCGKCKHLTGFDKAPYHCEKCGICRINGHRSFHCDICGVCLDIQLENNHKCRADSAHDECFICFEDAFTGCQILPCSHKVHKKCAQQMIRTGMTRCPICGESFAHKLERKPPIKRK